MNHLIPLTDCNVTFLDLGYATKENTNIIKSIIYEEGPIAVALNVNQEFISYWNIHHSSDDYYPDTHEPWGNQLNHIVVLVGWKDDPTIQNGGYWIVKTVGEPTGDMKVFSISNTIVYSLACIIQPLPMIRIVSTGDQLHQK